MKKRYAYRAYPDQGQQKQLVRLFGCVRVVFNDFIAQRRLLYQESMSSQVPFRHTAQLVTRVAKHNLGRDFLGEVSSVALQQSVRDAQVGYQNFFDSITGKRRGPTMGIPKFKKRSGVQKARFTRNAGFKVDHQPGQKWGAVRVPKIGWVRVRFSRDLPSEPSTMTLIAEPDGTYHVSFVVEDQPSQAPEPTHSGAGIDVGVNTLAAVAYDDDTSEDIGNPRYFKRDERKLARAQRALSRKQKGSKNKTKAKKKVAKVHSKIRRRRADHHHKLSRRLVDENQVIAFETLNIKGLARTRMAKSITDAGWGQLIRFTEAKAAEADRQVVRIDAWFPSSQICAECGCRDGKKQLHIRQWACPCCAAVLDRDRNAANNIMIAAGLAEIENACRGSIRPERYAQAEPMNQEPTEQISTHIEAA